MDDDLAWRKVEHGQYHSTNGCWRIARYHTHCWHLSYWGGVGWLTRTTKEGEPVRFDSMKEAKREAQRMHLSQELRRRWQYRSERTMNGAD